MKQPYTGKFLLLPVLLVMLLTLPYAFAQETTAGLQGVVKDPSGAIVVNATVELTSPALIGSKKVATDSAGQYRFAALAPGQYTLTVTATGFRTYKQTDIALSAGRLPIVDVKLEVGQLSETVTVSADAVLLDTTQSKVAVTLPDSIMDVIPKGRSFESLIPFAPGSRYEPLDSGYQIDGASDGENVYLIDGVNTTNIQNGGVGRSFQMDFIEEVQVKSSSFEAEFGGAIGGVVNAVPKHGSNTWSGSLVTYWRNNKLNANPSDRSLTTNPLLPSLNTTTRLDATPMSYQGKKDYSNTTEPGFEIGGPIYKDKVWLFASYIPSLSTTRRTTVFTGSNPGPRTLTSGTDQHNGYSRLDYGVSNSLRLFAAWNYAYYRSTGTLGGMESVSGQRNTGASTDPNTLRADAGSVNPTSVMTFGGDWTPTPKLVVSVRYGYFFTNSEQRGTPLGTRYLYNNTVNASSVDLAGVAFPSSSFNTSGFANIPSNLATIYNAYKRKSISADASYYMHFLGGTHTFKGGYFFAGQTNDVLTGYQGGFVTMTWGQAYAPVTSTSVCDPIIAQNVTTYGAGAAAAGCQGRYGYFTIGNGVVNTGSSSQTAHALYIQDDWTVGKGLTLNLGVRFDKETQPPYDPVRFPTVSFGWGEKIAPRLGGAYDLLHNGKIKVYASYGKFYDIMKMGLARGSFGSDYWHNCVYAMDSTSYTAITPTYQIGGGCPATGPAPGVTVGRFIENVDWRATKADPRDPAISPTMKPMLQHEFATGLDWAITKTWSFTSRYSRKRMDMAIEDMAITDNLGFYIGNPGSYFADVLHRPTVIPDANGNNYLNNTPFCAECPPVIGAHRRYDGIEFSLSKRATTAWWGSISYSYSALRGNYPGLTNTDPTDGGAGGRHAPNNSRLFDIPTMTYLPNGQIDDGPLSTDRPNTFKAFGFYRAKWFGGQTIFGITQLIYEGTPINTCLPVVGSSSACQWAEGRGNYVDFSRNADGSIAKTGVEDGKRTPAYLETDFTVRHEILPSREHEKMRVSFEANITNLLNQRSATSYYEFVIPTNEIIPSRVSRFSGDPNIDWGKMMNGYNYVDALNATGAFAGTTSTGTKIQSPLTLANRYGMPNGWEGARQIRLTLRFAF
ncbi:MAG: TonB-dependent receptor [Acidobacteriota bacterium]|jgi:outer membrane receptor protein involved in Fe transport